MVEPVHPGQGRKLDILEALPRTLLADHLRFEQSNDDLGQRPYKSRVCFRVRFGRGVGG